MVVGREVGSYIKVCRWVILYKVNSYINFSVSITSSSLRAQWYQFDRFPFYVILFLLFFSISKTSEVELNSSVLHASLNPPPVKHYRALFIVLQHNTTVVRLRLLVGLLISFLSARIYLLNGVVYTIFFIFCCLLPLLFYCTFNLLSVGSTDYWFHSHLFRPVLVFEFKKLQQQTAHWLSKRFSLENNITKDMQLISPLIFD